MKIFWNSQPRRREDSISQPMLVASVQLFSQGFQPRLLEDPDSRPAGVAWWDLMSQDGPKAAPDAKLTELEVSKKSSKNGKKWVWPARGVYSGRLFFLATVICGRFSCATRRKARFSHFCAIPFSQLWVGGCEWPWREALAEAAFAAWFPNKRG